MLIAMAARTRGGREFRRGDREKGCTWLREVTEPARRGTRVMKLESTPNAKAMPLKTMSV